MEMKTARAATSCPSRGGRGLRAPAFALTGRPGRHCFPGQPAWSARLNCPALRFVARTLPDVKLGAGVSNSAWRRGPASRASGRDFVVHVREAGRPACALLRGTASISRRRPSGGRLAEGANEAKDLLHREGGSWARRRPPRRKRPRRRRARRSCRALPPKPHSIRARRGAPRRDGSKSAPGRPPWRGRRARRKPRAREAAGAASRSSRTLALISSAAKDRAQRHARRREGRRGKEALRRAPRLRGRAQQASRGRRLDTPIARVARKPDTTAGSARETSSATSSRPTCAARIVEAPSHRPPPRPRRAMRAPARRLGAACLPAARREERRRMLSGASLTGASLRAHVLGAVSSSTAAGARLRALRRRRSRPSRWPAATKRSVCTLQGITGRRSRSDRRESARRPERLRQRGAGHTQPVDGWRSKRHED